LRIDSQTQTLDDEPSKISCSQPKYHHEFKLKPLHERLEKYYRIRQRIFGDINIIQAAMRSKHSPLRCRRYWKKICRTRKIIISSVFQNEDSRLYTEISIEGKTYKALLDSVATISCLGNVATREIQSLKKMQKSFGCVKTADGTKCAVIGQITTLINTRKRLG